MVAFTSFYAISALALLAVATPAPIEKRTTPTTPSQCNTGPIQCCNDIKQAKDLSPQSLLELGLSLLNLNVLLGLDCSPIGVGGGTCDAHPVCCTDNSHGNLVSVGCVVVSL